MIKVGDKVVCIKDYNNFTFSKGLLLYTIINKKGIVYNVVGISKSIDSSISNNQGYRVYISCDDCERNGSFFDITDDRINSLLFSEYFITMAECRENQIKTILDD
jgi:hypothetical protein